MGAITGSGDGRLGALPGFDAVVLAGGRARRLGGVSKPGVVVEGRRLLDHALAAAAGAEQVVVVAPESVAVPRGVLRTLEDPPLGGPVAGMAAGMRSLGTRQPAAEWVLMLACDAPWAAPAVPRLLAAAVGRDGAVLVDGDGRAQWLTAVYRASALRTRLAGRSGGRVREVVDGLDLAEVPARGREAKDIDTWTDLPSR